MKPEPKEPKKISIHAPREGSDRLSTRVSPFMPLFLSTLPARGATLPWLAPNASFQLISIHAPREGSDR